MKYNSVQLLLTVLNFASTSCLQIFHHLFEFCKSRIIKSQVTKAGIKLHLSSFYRRQSTGPCCIFLGGGVGVEGGGG